MLTADWGQYGIAFVALAVLAYFIFAWSKKDPGIVHNPCKNELSKVIANNTAAFNELSTVMKISMARQEQMLEELVAHARGKAS